jgi:hypothetical protein
MNTGEMKEASQATTTGPHRSLFSQSSTKKLTPPTANKFNEKSFHLKRDKNAMAKKRRS